MRKEIVLPVIAAAGGVAGFFLRRWELATAFESDSGLQITGMPATYALILLSAVMVVISLLLGRSKVPFQGGYYEAFDVKGNWAFAVVNTVAAFLLLISGVLNLYGYVRHTHDSVIRVLLGILCIITFVFVLVLTRDNLRRTGNGRFRFSLLVPAYNFCLWLICAYQERAIDPVIGDYVYQMFAIIASLLGLYFIASFSFGRGRVALTGILSGLGIYFSIVALADHTDAATKLLLGFAILYLLAGMVAMYANIRCRAGAPVTGATEPEITEPEITEEAPSHES
ncbi:MAG: hypothetical protein LUG13_08160 [Oscillospiraceae bacterium]|nr:hypothetical protein [Oscillospiraceae bacterium]